MKRTCKDPNHYSSIFLDDLYQAAYLHLNGQQLNPIALGDRVSFEVKFTPDVSNLIAELQRNEPVPVADFIRACKTVRGQMLALRGLKR